MTRRLEGWQSRPRLPLIACAVAPHAAPAQVTERLPDLVADAPANPQLQTFAQPDGNHLLLRFDGYVHNQGQGAFEMRGSARVGSEFTNVVQRVYRSDGSFFDDSSRDPHIIFEPEDGHDHWHLKDAARYSLWNEAKTAEVAPAMKTGFCLIDSQRRETHGPSSAGLRPRPAQQLLRPGRAQPDEPVRGRLGRLARHLSPHARLPVGGRERRVARPLLAAGARSTRTTGRARATR